MKHKMSLILFGSLIFLMIGGNQATGVSAGDPGKIPIPAPYTSPPTPAERVPWAPYDHNHLGQTWTGSNPLVITGTYETPWPAALVLNNAGGDGLLINSVTGRGIVVNSSEGAGLRVMNAGGPGVRVDNSYAGLKVDNAGEFGVLVLSAGDNGLYVQNAVNSGLAVDFAGYGLWVDRAENNGVQVNSAGAEGVIVDTAGGTGFTVNNAGVHGVAVRSAKAEGVIVESAGGTGFTVIDAGVHGVAVQSAGAEGVIVESAGGTGFTVKDAGVHGVAVQSATYEGLYVGSAGDNGLWVQKAGNSGVAVGTANTEGFQVGSAGDNGLWVQNAGNTGVAVSSSGNSGLWVGNAGGNGVQVDSAGGYAGWFGGSIYARDGCVGCTINVFGVNAGSLPLQPGDIVSIQGLLPSQFAEVATLMQVKAAERGETVIGVVQGRAEATTETNPQLGASKDRLVPRQGDVEPGGYVTIIIYGPAQVKSSSLSGSFSAGTRLTLGDDGGVRTLKTTEVNGVQIAESASTIGIALQELGDNPLIWVLVNPQ
jgi:hypothetical protein